MNYIKKEIMQQDNAEKIKELAEQIAEFLVNGNRVELSPSRSGFKINICKPKHIVIQSNKKSWKERERG